MRADGTTDGSGIVELFWNLVHDESITKFQVVYRKSSASGTETWRDIPDSGVRPGSRVSERKTSHVVTGLENGTEYSFWIRAVNAFGFSEDSDEKRATPKRPEDSIVVHDRRVEKFQVKPGDDRLRLGWKLVSGLAFNCGYVIEWRETGSGE